jgi:nitrous oxidase accessory protein NosD
MTRSTRSIIIALAALLLLAAAAVPAQAKKRGGGHREFVGPGESIQAAIDAAKPGTTIFVKGVHRENVSITKDRIKLRGRGAVLKPAATAAPSPCSDPSNPSDVNGVCVIGEGSFETGEVTRYVRGVKVTGFTIRDFPASGLFAFAAQDTTFARNRARDNGEYGIAAFTTIRTHMLFNRASGSEEAGLYVGDSPDADALLVGNRTSDNLFGIFIRNALGGKAFRNSVHGNCAGILVLGDAPGPAGNFRFSGNKVRHNSKFCPANEESPDPTSGLGIVLLGTTGVSVVKNRITDNVPGGDVSDHGGVIVIAGEGGTAPTDNRVRFNKIVRNGPDLVWDGSGTGNLLTPNRCQTSVPPELCD